MEGDFVRADEKFWSIGELNKKKGRGEKKKKRKKEKEEKRKEKEEKNPTQQMLTRVGIISLWRGLLIQSNAVAVCLEAQNMQNNAKSA